MRFVTDSSNSFLLFVHLIDFHFHAHFISLCLCGSSQFQSKLLSSQIIAHSFERPGFAFHPINGLLQFCPFSACSHFGYFFAWLKRINWIMGAFIPIAKQFLLSQWSSKIERVQVSEESQGAQLANPPTESVNVDLRLISSCDAARRSVFEFRHRKEFWRHSSCPWDTS